MTLDLARDHPFPSALRAEQAGDAPAEPGDGAIGVPSTPFPHGPPFPHASLTHEAGPRPADGRIAAILDGIGEAFYTLGQDLRFTAVNRSAEALLGRPREAILGRVIWELLPDSQGTPLSDRLERVLHTGRADSFDGDPAAAAGRHLEYHVFPYDGGLAVSIRDRTERRRAEEHLRLLVNELNHRVKNSLAIVQSLAAISFTRLEAEGGACLSEARRAFESRLLALARGHDLVTRENWEGASLRSVVEEASAACRTDGADRFRIAGEDVRVTPSMALSLSMALHELCANALKHGALKAPGGRVTIGWKVASAPHGHRLRLRWEESGGPPVGPRSHAGFGSRLIEGGLARELDGTARLHFDATGVVCEIDVPLP